MKEIWYIRNAETNEYYTGHWRDTWNLYRTQGEEYKSRELVIKAIEEDMRSEYPHMEGKTLEIVSYIEVPYKD